MESLSRIVLFLGPTHLMLLIAGMMLQDLLAQESAVNVGVDLGGGDLLVA